MKTQTITTTEEWLLTFREFGEPKECKFDDEVEAHEALNHKISQRSLTDLRLHRITTQTTATLEKSRK